MAAITAAVNRDRQDGDFQMIPLDASAGLVPKGAMVCNDASGYGVNGADTASYVFKGIAVESKTGVTSDGLVSVKVQKTGVWKFAFGAGSLAVTDEGTAVFITDNNTVDVAGTTTNDIACGVIVKCVDADNALVLIDGYAT